MSHKTFVPINRFSLFYYMYEKPSENKFFLSQHNTLFVFYCLFYYLRILFSGTLYIHTNIHTFMHIIQTLKQILYKTLYIHFSV